MVGEPLLMTGADLAGVRPLSTPDAVLTGSGLGGRGCVSRYRSTASSGFRATCFSTSGLWEASGSRAAHSALMAALLTGR